MPLNFVCPDCGKEHRQISSQFLGKRIKCTCGRVLRLGPKSSGTQESAASTEVNHSATPSTSAPPDSHLTQLENRDPVFGQVRPEEGFHPEYSLYNPVSPQEITTYVRTSIRPNFQPPTVNPHVLPPHGLVPADDGNASISARPLHPRAYYAGGVNARHGRQRGSLNLIAGVLGILQSVLVGVFLIAGILQLLSMWTAFGQGADGLSSAQIEVIRNQLLIATLILTVLLLMKVGFGVFSGWLLASGLQELSPTGEPRPDVAVNAAYVALAYNVLLLLVGVLIFVTSTPQGPVPEHFSMAEFFGSFLAVFLKVALLAMVPTFQILVGAIRWPEPRPN